jgi:CheY-like chemotaxis protein
MEKKRKSVLVIENDARVRNTLRRALEVEHEVLATAGAAEALTRIAAGQRFDLVLCKLMLPAIPGLEFHKRVGLHAPDLVPRIVFLTSGTHPMSAKAFLKRPDIRHIVMSDPSRAEFRDTVREHLERLTAPSGGSR